MPKPKKAKVPVSQTVAEAPAEEPPAPEPPAPCSPLPNKLTVVKPESPSQSLLLRAQRKARYVLSQMARYVLSPKRLQKADDKLEVALRTYSAKLTALEKAAERSGSRSRAQLGSCGRPTKLNWRLRWPSTSIHSPVGM